MICLADAGPSGTIRGMESWHPPRPRRHALRRWLPIAAGALLCYLGSYAAFSSWGQYVTAPEETPTGPQNTRTRWAPGEFYDFSTRRWRKSHTLVYAPLLWLDQRWWHPPPEPHPGPAASRPAGE
jgi:hypothetical protein